VVNRPAGGPRSTKYERAPYDWYCESERAVEQIFAGLPDSDGQPFFADDLIWDPCCGRGNVLDVAKRWGHPTVGGDVVDRNARHRFIRGNVLNVTKAPRLPGRQTSVISNTPYHYEPNIAARIMEHLLQPQFDLRRLAFIVPNAFLAGQERWRGQKFQGRYRPSHTLIYTERHTMPPGHLMDTMKSPFEGGMADYAVVVFTRPHNWRTETIWLPPGKHQPRVKAQTRGVANAA
jgi:hypothetical protein